jgi:hypothetical protein
MNSPFKPTKEEILLNIQRTYYLATALDIQIEWLRPYVKDDYQKAMSEAKAKNNFMRKRIKENLSKEAIEQVELIGEKLVDEFWEKMNIKLK